MMFLFPSARIIGGQKIEYSYKGKSSLFHLMTGSNGKPLYATLTTANENERTELPKLLDKIRIVGLSIIEVGKDYDSKTVRLEILQRAHYPLIPYIRKQERR